MSATVRFVAAAQAATAGTSIVRRPSRHPRIHCMVMHLMNSGDFYLHESISGIHGGNLVVKPLRHGRIVKRD